MIPGPVFTIIIPALNSGEVIGKAISSILAQTFAALEIIVVDGQSMDNTLDVICRIAKRDQRVRVVQEADNGIYDAMNKGISLARGEWLYFMGSDDYLWDENVLNDVFRYIEALNPDFVYGDVFSPDLGENYDGEFDIQKLYRKNICHQAVFCKRAVFEEVGMFDTRFRVLGDHDFTIRCFHREDILKSYFNRKIAYYGPAGASRTLDKIQLMKDRYLFAKTVSQFADRRSVERLHERLASQLVDTLGARVILFGGAKSTLHSFLAYDPVLMRRLRRVIFNRTLSRIRK